MRLRYTHPLSLPNAYPGTLLTNPSACIALEPPGQPRGFDRYAPAYIIDPSGTDTFKGFAADHYDSPPAYTLSLPGAIAFGYRALAWDGRFCLDDCPLNPQAAGRLLQYLGSGDTFLGEDTALRTTDALDVLDLPVAPDAIRTVPKTVLSLCSHEPSNYGSFLFRVVTKLATVEKLALGPLDVLVWAHFPNFQDILHLAGISADRIVQHDTHTPTRYERVIAPSLRNPHAFLDPESASFFQRLAGAHKGPGLGRFLYVSRLGQARRGASSRRMINEVEVVTAAARLGFTIIEPETLTPEQQIAAFANADVVAGPSGSGMFNCVFCRPGTKVLDIESEPNWIYAHAGLFASCKLEYGLFVGAVDPLDGAPVHKRFQVDVPALEAQLSRLIAQQ